MYTACGVVGAVLFISLSSFASGQPSPQLFFVMFGFYQLLLMMLLLRFRFPQELLDYLQTFNVVSLNFSFLYNIPKVEWLSQQFSGGSYGDLELERIDLENDTFLANYLSTIIFLIFLALLHLTMYLIYL